MGHSPFLTCHLYIPIILLTLSLVHSSFDSDKSALLAFKTSLIDPNQILSTWQGLNHCSWFGVTCDLSFRVLGVNLSGGGGSGTFCSKFDEFPIFGGGVKRVCYNNGLKLSGSISNELAKLTELKVFSVPFNEISGELPIEIMGMKNLEVLDLEGNSISGSLPDFTGLSRLRVLNLGFNDFVGEMPRSLSNCTSLQVLNLAGNKINGTIPEFIGSFRDLKGVYLSYNLLGGTIPREIGDNCGELEYLELAGNFIEGGIPSTLGKCRRLRNLVLSSNLLVEIIPIELGQLNKLEVLDLSRNSLSGPIPRELGNCSELKVLVLSNLFDPLPIFTKLGDSKRRQPGLDQEFNFFEAGMPSEITTLSKLKMIWAPKAIVQSRLPDNWGVCNNLEMVNLGQNLFNGEFSRGFYLCKKLSFLDLSSNRLKGEIFDKLLPPCLSVFDVSENFLSGSIPRFNYSACLHTYTNAMPDDLSAAYLSFFFDKSKAEFSSPLKKKGVVISVYHNFSGNNFTGALPSIPVGLKRLSSGKTVYAFLAGDNKLNRPFLGDLIQNCDGLNGLIVNVSNNKLSGQLPMNTSSICKSLILLDASGNEITGTIPTTIGDLISLFSLDLSGNMLQGQIPNSIGLLNNLDFLSLAVNNLSGPIPKSLGQLSSLQVLNLSHNSFSGEIPNNLTNLTNLEVLLLDNNKLLGQIPSGLANLTTLSTFNVSFNNLSGPLLSSGNLMKCSNVQGNPFLQSCRIFSLTTPSSDSLIGNHPQNDPSPPTGSPKRKDGFNSIEIASITSASAIVSVLIALVMLFFYTRWNSRCKIGGFEKKEVTIFTDIGVSLTFEDVVKATGSFNASNCIGTGGFGATYKAEISPGVLVAIKKLAVGRFQGVQQFEAEIKTLGRLRHPNLVTLIGYHASESEMFLIYNYLPGGNLEKFIRDRSTRKIDWRVLHKIALDIARALAYLHDQCVPRVLHRDVKPSNILLDNDYNAYLSDFGLARLLGTSETHVTTGVAGTFGYVAPEYAMTCRCSDKADVYSYGVVLLEILSDKKLLDPSFWSFGNGFNIVQWSCMQLRQGRAKDVFSSGLWDVGPHDDLVEVLHLAVVCTVESLSTRPTMKQVVRRLKQLQPPSC